MCLNVLNKTSKQRCSKTVTRFYVYLFSFFTLLFCGVTRRCRNRIEAPINTSCQLSSFIEISSIYSMALILTVIYEALFSHQRLTMEFGSDINWWLWSLVLISTVNYEVTFSDQRLTLKFSSDINDCLWPTKHANVTETLLLRPTIDDVCIRCNDIVTWTLGFDVICTLQVVYNLNITLLSR